MQMNETKQTQINIVEPDYVIHVEILKGPVSYAACSELNTTTITNVDIDAIARRNEHRFQEAWRELADK